MTNGFERKKKKRKTGAAFALSHFFRICETKTFSLLSKIS
jgi:hypothetical protein